MNLLTPLLLALAAGVAFAAPVPKGKAPPVDLRDEDGKVVISADEIVGYDWDTHTLTLKDADLKTKLYERKKFAVCIDGKSAFEVVQMSPVVSRSYPKPVVVVPEIGRELPAAQVRIQGGYPGLLRGSPDLRQVPELRDALEKAGKLKAEKK